MLILLYCLRYVSLVINDWTNKVKVTFLWKDDCAAERKEATLSEIRLADVGQLGEQGGGYTLCKDDYAAERKGAALSTSARRSYHYFTAYNRGTKSVIIIQL